MKCPFCGSILSKVVDKRAVSGSGEIRRRRECLKCSKRFTTYESLSALEILIIKKDGRREIYDRSKLEQGLVRALEKRPDLNQVSKIVDKVEGKIRSKGAREVPSSSIGKWVLIELKKLDRVAYLRFASVYRTFQELSDFEKEMKTL